MLEAKQEEDASALVQPKEEEEVEEVEVEDEEATGKTTSAKSAPLAPKRAPRPKAVTITLSTEDVWRQ